MYFCQAHASSEAVPLEKPWVQGVVEGEKGQALVLLGAGVTETQSGGAWRSSSPSPLQEQCCLI